jgi:murein L,D-transpeptidase YafK
MKQIILSITMLIALIVVKQDNAAAQNENTSIKNAQMSFTRVAQAYTKFNEPLKAMFLEKGLSYPPKEIYIRSFKSQNEMELWAREQPSDSFKLVKSYRVCALSGILGPKRVEGDKQVPEGCYFIDDFNPQSDFYLSMLLNYPNYSDLIKGDKKRPGGDIYIHGGCMTVGCLPMTNDIIQELYVLCLNTKLNGQNYIPVSIYPTRFNKKGYDYLKKTYSWDEEKLEFWSNLKIGYDYFEKNKKMLPVMYTPDGKYIF